MLAALGDLSDLDVVEMAPGSGTTAAAVLGQRPRSYTGVERDAGTASVLRRLTGDRGTILVADAAATDLASHCADVVIGEALLTMQSDRAKDAIVAETARLLRPGGRCAVHELALVPDDLNTERKTEIRQALARPLRVNARPLTLREWAALFSRHGLTVTFTETAPMALLEPRRVVADEGALGATRFAFNVLTRSAARGRVLQMRRALRAHRAFLRAVVLVAHKTDAE
ncbi:methyltransferase domain-containing protein [Streptomyces sp. NPDC013178]|uniref:class I SAM-dependent methyltransferase n=1 Tax=Streptomyces sp. NPDC013178 TaxID=3155118 RepID=UPI0033D4EEB6